MEETPPQRAGRRRRTQKKNSSLTMQEMDAVLQLIQLTHDSRHHYRTEDDANHNTTAIDRKVKEEEEEEVQSTGDSAAVSFSSVIQKILPRQEKSSGQPKRKLGSINMDIHRITTKPAFDKNGQRRRTQKGGDTTQPEMNAAQQLIQLCHNSDSYEDVKAKEEEEEERSDSDTSYITDASSAMETQLEINAAQQMLLISGNYDSKYTEGREKEAKGGGGEESKSNKSDLSSVRKGVFMKEREAFCPRKTKFRSVVDIYRTTKPLNVAAAYAKKVRHF